MEIEGKKEDIFGRKKVEGKLKIQKKRKIKKSN